MKTKSGSSLLTFFAALAAPLPANAQSLSEPLIAQSAPQTDINRQFESLALAYLGARNMLGDFDCLNLFPDRRSASWIRMGFTRANLTLDEAVCLYNTGSYMSAYNKEVALRALLVGGIVPQGRMDFYIRAEELGLTINDDTFDLCIAAHDFFHAIDTVRVDKELRADIFAALVLQVMRPRDWRDMLTLADHMRAEAPLRDSHYRNLRLPQHVRGLRLDVGYLADRTEEIYRQVRAHPRPVIRYAARP